MPLSSEPDFRLLFEAAPSPMLVLTPDFIIAAVNEAYLYATRTTREDILGRNVFDVFPDNPLEPGANAVSNLRASLLRVLDGKRSDSMPVQRYDIRVPGPDGPVFDERYWSPINTPVFDAEGRLTHIIHRVEDVTDVMCSKLRMAQMETQISAQAVEIELAEQRIEQDREAIERHVARAAELTQEQADFHLLLTAVPIPVTVLLGPEHRYLFENAAHHALHGRDILGKTFADVFPGAAHLTLPVLDRIYQTGEPYLIERHKVVIDQRQNGEPEDMYFKLAWHPLFDAAGKVKGIITASLDITDLVLVEKKLSESEQRYRSLFESIDEGFCIIEMLFDAAGQARDYRFCQVNPTFEKQTGMRDVVGKTIRQLAPDLEQHWFDIYGQVARTGEPIRFVNEAKALGRWFDVYAYPGDAACSNRVALLFNDITQRVKAEEALKQSSRRKDEFLAMLAHELRNPLAPIAAAAEVLRIGQPDEARIKWTSSIISRQVRHMTGLVDDLLDVSRITRGLVSLDKIMLDAKRVVFDAIEQVRPLIESRGHRLAVHAPPEPAFVLGDRKRLVQVMANLLNNAAKYTPEGGDIVLDMRVDARYVEISVSDNGIGMTPELAEEAFELFVQAERTPDRSQGGLGIGLALVKSLVGLHDGRVSVHSDGPGEGSRFTVCLPYLGGAVDTEETEPDVSFHRDPRTALTVLVVDDNVDAANMLAMLVDELGHRTIVEHRPESALKRALKESPDVCLLDIGLPDMDGNELAKRLRDQPQTARAILVAVTGYGQTHDRDSALNAGFDHYFVKPIDGEKLAAILNGARKNLPADGHA